MQREVVAEVWHRAGARRHARECLMRLASRRSIHGRSSRTAAAAARSGAREGSTTSTSACAWTLTRTRRARAERRTVVLDLAHARQITACAGHNPPACPNRLVRLPRDVREPYQVYLNGSRSSSDATSPCAPARSSSTRSCARTGISGWRWLLERGRRHLPPERLVDVRYEAPDGSPRVARAWRSRPGRSRAPTAAELQRAEDRARRRPSVERVEVNPRRARRKQLRTLQRRVRDAEVEAPPRRRPRARAARCAGRPGSPSHTSRHPLDLADPGDRQSLRE